MKESYTYPAIFEFYDDGGIGVFFPDLPGCVSCGDDEEDAIEMAKEALGGHLFCMIEDGDPIPTASRIRDINLEKDQASVLITTWMPIIREKVMQSSGELPPLIEVGASWSISLTRQVSPGSKGRSDLVSTKATLPC